MPIVDSHVHVSEIWYEPVEMLLAEMEQNGVDHAVLVQMNSRTDNSYLFQCVRRFPGRFAPVVWIDTNSAAAPEELRRLAGEGASGVRFRPFHRSPGEDPLAIWRTASDLGLAVSCGGTATHFGSEEFTHLVESLPNLTIVLEHLGSNNKPQKSPEEWEALPRAIALARFPNVYIKVDGFGVYCKRAMPARGPFPFEEPIPPLLEQAYQAFGARRMMWGSDFPPVSNREGYRNALRLVQERLAAKSQEERDLIFGQVALSVFPIRG